MVASILIESVVPFYIPSSSSFCSSFVGSTIGYREDQCVSFAVCGELSYLRVGQMFAKNNMSHLTGESKNSIMCTSFVVRGPAAQLSPPLLFNTCSKTLFHHHVRIA
jgi:hypothetical protein